MKRLMVGLGLLLALAVAAQQVDAASSREEKKEKEKKEERRRKRREGEANREYPGRITGVIKSCSEYELVVTVKSRKGQERDVTVTLNENTKVAGLKKDEALTDVPEGSRVLVAYTHKKDDPLNGTAAGVKVLKRKVEKAEGGDKAEE